MENIYKDRIERLRALMTEQDLAAYVIFSGDDHGSEYVGEHFRCVEFISGFDGSAGTVVVLRDSAGLWTDGRYFIQAEEQLAGTGITLFKSGEEGVPEMEKYLSENLNDGDRIGYDGFTVTCYEAQKIKDTFEGRKVGFVEDVDLCGELWQDRPEISHRKVWSLSSEYTGSTRGEKLKRVREEMQKEKADCHILSALDSIAYLYDLRGDDIAYNPVMTAFSVIFEDRSVLYCREDALDEELKAALEKDNVLLKPYDSFIGDVSNLRGNVLVDGRSANVRVMSTLQANADKGENVTVIDKPDPEILMKAVKNDVEMAHIRNAHIKDGAAVTKLIYWLKHHEDIESLTETDVADKLVSIRKEMDGYIGESFDPIIAEGAHGAIVHYSASEKTNAHIEKNTFLLMDTGAQFMDGTTDITRTVTTGQVTDEMKKHYTAVLKGHLRLSAAVFKECNGTNIDILAREPLWELGLDYNHGTGHGVGYVLNVHEGPQSIRTKHLKSDVNIKCGMLTSDEPGLYLEGKYGIRTENLMLCVPYKKTEYGEFLTFDFVTMVPYDRSAIDFSDMTRKDMDILEKYYKKVRESISSYLTVDERAWLDEETDLTDLKTP